VVEIAFDHRALAVAGHLELAVEIARGGLGGDQCLSRRDAGAHAAEQERCDPGRDRRARSAHRTTTPVTGGKPLTTRLHRSPPSSDRNTEPSSVPNTTSAPSAAR